MSFRGLGGKNLWELRLGLEERGEVSRGSMVRKPRLRENLEFYEIVMDFSSAITKILIKVLKF